jgi:transcriptional regulator GlxA family with amidase domain
MVSHDSAGRFFYEVDDLLKRHQDGTADIQAGAAGGVTAYMDLSLYLTSRFGSAELAASLSKTLLIDPARKSQTPYTAFDFNTAHGDENVLKAQDWMARNMTNSISIALLADIAGLGERTFARRFKKATGDTPP